jgi:hypothetical protein
VDPGEHESEHHETRRPAEDPLHRRHVQGEGRPDAEQGRGDARGGEHDPEREPKLHRARCVRERPRQRRDPRHGDASRQPAVAEKQHRERGLREDRSREGDRGHASAVVEQRHQDHEQDLHHEDQAALMHPEVVAMDREHEGGRRGRGSAASGADQERRPRR